MKETPEDIIILHMGCVKIQNAGMAIYGARNNKSRMQNTDQQIRNAEHGTDNPEWKNTEQHPEQVKQ